MKKAGLSLIIVFIFLTPLVIGPASEGDAIFWNRATSNGNESILSDWQDENSGTGAARPVDFQGMARSIGTSIIDSTHSAYIGIDPPLGWSSDQLEAQLDHLSMWVDDVLVNPNLNAYHLERWLVTDDLPDRADSFDVPDGWTLVKNDAPGGRQHPKHGCFEIDRTTGYDGSVGWRFEGNELSGKLLDPSIGFYMSQQVSAPWRGVYSAEITFRYYVYSTSVMDDLVYVFTSLEGYVSKQHVFEVGVPTETWLQGTATVPASFFESLEVSDSLLFNIGLGTDFTGTTSTGDHEVIIDEIELRLQVRPFPEQIDLLANGARVTGSTEGSVSPYVPDGSNRDCYSGDTTNWGAGGIDLDGYDDTGFLDVGCDVFDYPDWSTAEPYNIGFQFPLYVPQGSAISSAVLQMEAAFDSTGHPGMRIYVADEDDVSAFTAGYPLLEDRYDWVNTSIYWRPTTWLSNGRYDTPDLSALIQQVVSRPGWQSGNYICVMVDYAYSTSSYEYNNIKGSVGYAQGDLARLFVDFIAPDTSDVIPSFRFNKNIVIDHTKVVSDLQDFPVLVDIWDADLHLNVQPDGDDIAFLFNGQVIPHEIDVFDKQGNGTHAHLSAWVKVPYLSSLQDTTIVMVYGDDDLGNQENPDEIWDSDYSAVWHLNENPSQPQWSSTYADYLPHQPQIVDVAFPSSNGISYGSMTSNDLVDGVIGGAIDLEGTNDYLDFGNPSELQMSGAFTVEAWFYADYIDNDYLVVKSGESNYRGWDLSFDDDPSISPAGWVMFRWSPDGINMDLVGYERVDTGQWYQVVGVFCPSTFARFYLNGELVGEVTSGLPTSVNDPNRPVRIGRRSDTAGATSYFDGIVDEVRISNIARSDGWIKTQYMNQRNPELFLVVGEESINFRYMKDITIDHNQVASDLSGFRVLIEIFDRDLHTDVQIDGGDIMFVSNGRSLPHEIELFDQQYNSTHAHLIAWVKADLSSTSDTILTMYYGNPSSGNQENPNDVWRSDYAGVWHLSESTGNADDSSPFDLSGSISGGVARNQPGVIGTCYVFDGNNGNVNFGNPADGHFDFGENEFTYSAWVRIDQSTGDYQLPIFKGGTMTSDIGYEMETNTAGTDIKAELSDGSTVLPSDVTSVTFGQWMYLVAVVDSTSGYLRFYMNGTIVGSPTSISSLGDLSNSQSLQLSQSTYPIDGAIDEFRLISEARTAEWILTEYNNQKDPSGFYSVGIEREIITPEEVPLEFLYKKDFTIDHNKVESDLAGFPVLIDIYDTDLRTDVQADGDDIVFVKDGWMLPYEVELFEQSHNSSHAHLVAWVRMDLSSVSDTVFSMWYGNPYSENYEDPEGVWDTSFAAVWHLSEDPAGTIYDSTTNGNDGISLSSGSGPTLQEGKIDGCSEFYGETTKDRIESPHSSSLVLPSNILVEAWIRTSNLDPTSDAIVAKWGDVGHRNYWLGKLNSSTLAFYVDNTQSVTASLSLVNDGEWHHVVGVANADTGELLLYIDGIESGNAFYSGSTQTGTSVIQIANNPGSVGFIQEWDGRIDEVRVSSSYRSSGWIATEFNNQYDPYSFYAITGETTTSGAYEFSRQITVTAGAEPVPAGYSISITIDHEALVLAEKSQAGGDDLRILYWNGLSFIELDRVLDSDSSWNSATTKIWFKIQSDISASTSDDSYYLYYGNPTVSAPPENHANVFQFYDGFESGDLSAWDGSYTDTGDSLSVTTEQANTGDYSAKGDVDTQAAAQAMVWKDLSDLTNIFARVHFYLPATFSTTDHVTIMQFVDTSSGWVNQLSLTIRDDMTFYLWNAIAGEAYGYGTTSSISTGSWHMLELQAKFSATTGEARMWLDGNLEVEETGKNLGAEGIDRFCTVFYWASPQTESNTVYADDAFLRLYVNPEPTTSLGTEVTQEVQFNYKKDITIDHTKVNADLNDFPLLIDIFDTDLRTDVQADGDDIIFKSGETILPHELELFDQTYNSTHAHLVAWVKTDLSSSSDTTISMYYGSPQASNQEDPTSVWNDDYMGVWHLGETSGGSGAFKDSTSNINHGTDAGGPTLGISGPIGNAIAFDGDDDVINCGNGPSLTISGDVMTIEAWAYLNEDTPPQWGSGIAEKTDSYSLFQDWDASRRFSFEINADARTWTSDSGKDLYRWYHVVGVYDGTNTYLYVDGFEASSYANTGPVDASAFPLYIGRGDQYFEGRIDEVRVLNIDKSADWILTEFRNQNDPSSFYTIGAETSNRLSEFEYKKDIVVDHTKVSSNLMDFPLLIDIFDTDLRTDVQADGDDIIFTIGETLLPHEIELFDRTYNSTHAHLVAWVKTDLSSSADTTISMYYGNPSIYNQERPSSVWNSNYVAVWHMNQDPSSSMIKDSTINGYDLTPIGFSSDQRIYDGKLGTAISADGTDDRFVIYGISGPVNDFTFQSWFALDNVFPPGSDMHFFRGNSLTNNYPMMRFAASSGLVVTHMEVTSDDDETCTGSKSSWEADTWFQFAWVRSMSAVRSYHYLDGSLDATDTSSDNANPHLVWDDFAILSDFSGGNMWGSGAISEFRIVNISLSPEWIEAEYLNQNDPSSFYSIGVETPNQPIEFGYKKDIVVDHSKVASDLTDFPMLIEIFDTDLRTDVRADGDDIIFKSGETMLPHELELFDQTYNSTHAHLVAWVKTDLSSSADTTISMYYGNPQAPNQEDPTGVWNDGYMGVWHLSEASGIAQDSTDYQTHGTPSGLVTQGVSGRIGNAYQFDRDGVGTVNMGDPADGHLDFGNTDDFTIEFWVNLDYFYFYEPFIVSKRNGLSSSNQGYAAFVSDDNNGYAGYAVSSDGPQFGVDAATSLLDSGWRHVVYVFDQDSATISTIFVDGADDKSSTWGTIGSVGSLQNSENFRLNGESSPSTDDMFDGMLDEVRISRVARSAEWILTEFDNQNDPSSFYSIGTEETLGEEATATFSYKKDITIDHTKIASDLTDFPMLIDIFDTDLRTDVQADGDDIIFKQGTTMLPHEIEIFNQTYNSTHAHLVAWVKVDLSSSVDTTISMYYGSPQAKNQEDPSGVWNGDYKGVWHLSEDPTGTFYDSTSNSNHGTGNNLQSDDQVEGQIDGSIDFDHVDDYIDCGNDTSLNVGSNDFSLSLWFNYDGVNTGVLAGKGAVLMARRYRISIESGPGMLLAAIDDNTVAKNIYSTSTYGDSLWHHVSLVRDGNNLRLYIDGVEDPNSPIDITGYGSLDESESFYINAFRSEIGGTIGYMSTANIDEVRVVNMALSPEWIAAEYSNQLSPDSFYSIGEETTPHMVYQPGVHTTDFKYKKNLVVDHTKVSADLTDFAMLIDIFDADLRTDVQADGDDIMFKNGPIWCPHEITFFDQTYNETHAHLIAWVKTDLSSSVDTIITMYYGNPYLSSQECPIAVWSNYVGVWHLDDSPTEAVYDSSQYNNDGETLGSMSGESLVLGQIGNGFALDGINDMINVSESSSLDSIKYAGTLSLWINWANASNDRYQRVMTTSDRFILNPSPPPTLFQDDGFEWAVQGDGDLFFYPWGGDSIDYNLATNPFANNIWHHLVVTLDYSTKSVIFYLDGVPLVLAAENVPTQWTQLASLGDWLWGGNQLDAASHFDGIFDEIRAANVVRSAGWILTEYNNQYDPSSFYSIGSEEEITGKGYEFSTSSDSGVTIGVSLSLGVNTSTFTYASENTTGTLFAIINGSVPTWTAYVLVSPPPEVEALSFEVSYPEGDWYPFSVKNPTGVEKSFTTDWTCFDGRLIVGSSAIDEYGMWQIQFQDRNHVFDTQMGPTGGPYSSSDEFSIGEDIEFRVWSSGTIGSTVYLDLTDPSGSTWYSGSTTFQGQRFSLPYYHRKHLTISHESVATDLVDFPALIDIYDADLRTDVRADGRDIAFAIGEETLTHELELFDQTYNGTHAHLVAWVKVPLLSGSSDTVISMYYGNPIAPIVYESGPVWDSGYLGVWHLDESGTGALDEYLDSSIYQHHGQGGEGNTSYVPTQTSGKIGFGQDFNNLDGYYDLIDCGDSPLWNIDGYQITLEAWIQHDITPNTHVYGIMNHKGWYDGYALYVNYGGGSTLKPTFALQGDTHQLVGANDVTGGAWHHIVATYDGSLMRIYVDGVQDPNVLAKTDAILPSAYEQGFWIGHGDQPKDKVWSAEWDGQIDEVRISDVVRSAGWIQTEFNNQYDPAGFYSVGGEESAGYSESAAITLDSSALAGVWHASARYSDSTLDVNSRVGLFSRSFSVKRGATLSLTAPGDAVSDGTTAKLIGEGLYVEYELADALTSEPISGATLTMNWTVSGIPTQVQLNDYGDGSYGKVLNTTDLGTAQRWRIEITSDHQFYSDATSVLFLDLSGQTYLTYEPPSPTAYGDDFTVKVTVRDSFSKLPITNAGFTSNGTLVGMPIDYGNGTYLLTIDSLALSIGEHAFRFTATPTDSYLMSSSIDVKFNYRSVYTEAYAASSDPVEIPWGEDTTVTIQWNDLDHAGIGIEGGTLSILPSMSIQTVEGGTGIYTLSIDMASYTPGTYVFDVFLSKANYQDGTISITVIVRVHRTSVSADYNPTTPVGTSTYFDITFLDIDGGSISIGLGNLSQIDLDWGSGSQSFFSYGFLLDTSSWAVGVYTINITVYSTTGPTYYDDATISIELEIKKLHVYINWDHLEPFPNGNDFEIFVHLNVSEPGTSVDGDPINGLAQSYFTARNETGSLYNLKIFAFLGDGQYRLVIDQSTFQEGEYTIVIFVDFLLTEDYIDSQTPVITFTYRPILTYLSSDDYPTVTTTYDTNITILLNYVDIDHGVNITSGIITAEGASIVWQHLGDGFYEVLVIVQGWDLGSHEVNITADAVSYQAKTLSFEVLVQIAYAYARSSTTSIDLPVGDTAVFYVDYWDIIHNEPILGANIDHNWTHGLTIIWTGTQYRVELPSYDTDILGTYLIMFNVSKQANYQFGYFNVSLTLRTHYTEFRLAAAVEPTTYNGMVNVSLYYGDLDNDAGILSQYVNASVYGNLGWIASLLENDTVRGDGFYILRFSALSLGEEGIFNFTVYLNWTGAVQQYYNGMIKTSVNIIGEESELSLEDSPGPTPYLENMTYAYFYSELYSGNGISNSSGNVFIFVEFIGVTVDPSLISINEGASGHYTIEFNTTIFAIPDVYTMIVFVNWSKFVTPFYDNRTDTIAVRVIPRNTVVAVTPPDSTPYGVNATFSFSFDDMTDAIPSSIPNDTKMHIAVNLPDYSITYNITNRRFYVSFNTSVLGASLGSKQFTISVTWDGAPFYANVTARTVLVSVTARETSFDFATPTPTSYGEIVSFIVTYSDVTEETSSIEDGIIALFNASVPIPGSFYNYMYMGNGEYLVELNTTFYDRPGSYTLTVEISTGEFYYLDQVGSRTFNVKYRITTLAAEPVGTISYNSSILLVMHYRDLLSLLEISNTSYLTSIEIMNGSSWFFTSEWRGTSMDYLVIVQTYNQVLDVDRDYLLWIRFSYSDSAPFYLPADAYVSFRLRERTTVLDLIDAPTPAQYLDAVNFTVAYLDLELTSGIVGAEILLSIDGSDLVEGSDYILQTIGDGDYFISVSTTSIGTPGTLSNLLVRAQWTSGSPYYSGASIQLTVGVVERSASVSIITSPSLVRFLENVTFTFIYSDDTTNELITLTKDMVSIYSGGVLLQNTDFMMQFVVDSYEISINSAILSLNLVTNWNVTVFVDWSSTTVPYYTDDAASVGVTVTNRVGLVSLGTAPVTPIGDNMSLTFSYKDEGSNQGIGNALVEFDCLSPSGLVENVNFWVIRGTGVDTGKYTILVDTTHLNGIGQYTFSLRLLWNPSLTPYYRNTSELYLSGSVRLIQSLLTNDEPSPSTVPINDNVTVILTFTDLDHGLPIIGALPNITVIYKSDGSTPSIWNLVVVSPGVYELIVNCTDISLIGTDALVIRASMSMYQFAEVQIPIQIRARQGELSKLPPPDAYFGEETYAIVELVDLDASSTPIPDAILSITWPDSSSYEYIGNGRYNITLSTTTMDAGLYTLVVSAQKLNYFIPDISISIRVLSIPSEIILPQKIADVYWGDMVSVWALFNDTRSGSLISGANVVYEFGILGGSLSEGVPAGNYSFSVDTGNLPIATTYVISITASLNNYITATGQVTVNILRLGLELTIVDGLHDQTLYKGEAVNITVFVRDTYNDVPLMGATVIADWALTGQSVTLTQVPGRDGYYTGLLNTEDTLVKTYVIVVRASRTNYVSMSTSASVTIEQIPTVVWLDPLTATYSSTSFNWSDTIRVGVYVLSPFLNLSYPYSTGLSNCTVTWSLSGTYITGEFLDGAMLEGPGYFYFDFRTWEYNATTYTFRIVASPHVKAFAQSSNMTTLTINPVETTVDSSYVSPKVWGWAGWVNLTYWDLLDDRGVVAASVGIDWYGQEEISRYVIDGVYQVWINTSLVSPGVYPVVVNFWKQNHEAGTGVFTLTVQEVPTDIVVYAPEENLDAGEVNLIVPYGDLLSLTLFYNDTWYNQGIAGATELVAVIMGDPIATRDNLTILEISHGNYSLVIDSGRWTVSSIPYRIAISMGLENRSRVTLTLQLAIIDIPTALDIESATIVLSYSQTVTVWVFYHSIWESHNNRGISGGDVNATSLDTAYVVVTDWRPDDSRAGWYEITLRSQRTQGSAVVSIELSKENHLSASLTVAVSVEPSDMDILIERTIIFGFPIGAICLAGIYLYSRIFSVPKLLRKIRRMVTDVGKGRIPKIPEEARTRQEMIAELFNDIAAPIGVVKKAEAMPKFSVTTDVPEIEELLIQLSILSELTPEELEDFRNDVSKMKLSEQVAFAKEVINQEAIKRSKIERKSMEMVLAETAEQARAQIAGKEFTPKPKAPEEVITDEEILQEESESEKPELLEAEEELPTEFLRESEIEEVRKQLVDAGIKDNELDTIMEQVRELPKELVDELIDSILKKGGDKP